MKCGTFKQILHLGSEDVLLVMSTMSADLGRHSLHWCRAGNRLILMFYKVANGLVAVNFLINVFQ